MSDFVERRKYPRLPIELKLDINTIYKQDYDIIKDLDKHIDVIDISMSGIGFVSGSDLPLNYYFDATFLLNDGEFFIAVVKIIRKFKLENDNYNYGAEFVGLAPFLAEKIKKYGESLVKNNKK